MHRLPIRVAGLHAAFLAAITAAVAAGALLLAGCASASTKPDRAVTNTYWKLTELGGVPVKVAEKQREPHMILQVEANHLAGSGGCNRMMGSYTLDGESISFGQVASTMMACEDGMEQEQAFFKALNGARRWSVQGDDLALLDEGGTALARFVAVDLK
jgi:heat shock protein HslJ